MSLVDQYGIEGEIISSILSDSETLPLDAAATARLLSFMQPGDHTYLAITSPTATEAVKITVIEGRFKMARGFDNQIPRSFPRGSCVTSAMPPAYVREIACEMLV